MQERAAQQVIDLLQGFVSDWDSQFSIRVTPDEFSDDESEDVFDVRVEHVRSGRWHDFRAAVSRAEPERVRMETMEDTWQELTEKLFWCWLYLDLAWKPR